MPATKQIIFNRYLLTYRHYLSLTRGPYTWHPNNTLDIFKKFIYNYVTMSKYTPLITALESPAEIDSFNAVAKRLGFNPAAAYVSIQRVRPDLLGPRSARLGFSQVNKTDVSDSVRAEALAQVLAGRPVKEVASETGVPAPTLYQMARKAREKEAAKATDNVILTAGGSAAINPHDKAILDVLLASIRAASAQLGTQPEHLCDLLKSQLQH